MGTTDVFLDKSSPNLGRKIDPASTEFTDLENSSFLWSKFLFFWLACFSAIPAASVLLCRKNAIFQHQFLLIAGRDGRNYTARAIYPCWYDPENPDFVVIDFNPSKTLMLLIFFVAIPGGVFAFSWLYICGCSRFIFVGDDGHMRLKCCGEFVTGIGNVPLLEPPRKTHFIWY